MDASFCPVIVINDVHLKPALTAAIVCRLPADKLILPVGHNEKSSIRPDKNPVKVRHLHIRLQHDLFLSTECPIDRIGKRARNPVLPLGFFLLPDRLPHVPICRLIRTQGWDQPLLFHHQILLLLHGCLSVPRKLLFFQPQAFL